MTEERRYAGMSDEELDSVGAAVAALRARLKAKGRPAVVTPDEPLSDEKLIERDRAELEATSEGESVTG